ncbi:MAG: isoprenylcysteine carboxylmethyltransferase family protein [Elusimicrobia bacterium]|nr:isoprenylcysteine carboxylmethyltransferase family protein [Elusimicrobiota bacterium]
MNIIALLLTLLTLAGAWAEWWTLPKKRDQLDIPRGDVLTYLLGSLPTIGAVSLNLWCWLRSPVEPRWWLVAPGFILCAAALAIRCWGKAILGQYYTFSIDVRQEHKIIDYGPYHFVRHPLYLGALLGVLGVPMMTQSVLALLVFSVPVAVVYGLRLFLEDKFLLETLGLPYAEYSKRTPRLIPFVW